MKVTGSVVIETDKMRSENMIEVEVDGNNNNECNLRGKEECMDKMILKC